MSDDINIGQITEVLNDKADDVSVVHKTGDETIGGNKTFTSEVKVQGSANAYRIVTATYGSFWRQDEKSLYLMLTNAGDPTGTWNSLRPLMVNLETGVLTTMTPATTSNDNTVATTAWVNSKLQVVSTLPSSPNANTFYFIKE